MSGKRFVVVCRRERWYVLDSRTELIYGPFESREIALENARIREKRA